MEPAEKADDGRRDEEGENEGLPEGFGGIEQRGKVDDGESCEKSKPEDAGSQNGAGGVRGPENGEGGIERKEGKEEEFAVRYTRQ